MKLDLQGYRNYLYGGPLTLVGTGNTLELTTVWKPPQGRGVKRGEIGTESQVLDLGQGFWWPSPQPSCPSAPRGSPSSLGP